MSFPFLPIWTVFACFRYAGRFQTTAGWQMLVQLTRTPAHSDTDDVVKLWRFQHFSASKWSFPDVVLCLPCCRTGIHRLVKHHKEYNCYAEPQNQNLEMREVWSWKGHVLWLKTTKMTLLNTGSHSTFKRSSNKNVTLHLCFFSKINTHNMWSNRKLELSGTI